jgi:hypothetical protein
MGFLGLFSGPVSFALTVIAVMVIMAAATQTAEIFRNLRRLFELALLVFMVDV